MKLTYTILSALLLLTINSYAQNTFPATGNVGIGTTSPTLGLLHLNGSGADFLSMNQTNSAQYVQLNAYNNASFRIVQRSNAPLTLWTNTIERMRIDQTGNVGIGTTAPQTNLHIISSGTNIDGGNSLSAVGGGLIIQGNTGGRSGVQGAQLEFVIPANTDGSNAWGQGRIITVAGNASNANAVGKMIIGTRRSFNKLGTGSQWYYGNDLVIDGVGNIGIGTLTPDQKLSVNGTIHSKSVVIDLNGWSDYVFKKDYRLPSLSDVKAYIDQNQHLPEIPSEQEILKKGLNVGEMNNLLMKKVEELTLYLIEKDQIIKEQQKKLYDQELINKASEERLKRVEMALDSLKNKQ